MKPHYLLLILAMLLPLGACTTAKVDMAFKGKLKYSEEIKVITEYCQSCHLHHDFNSEPHLINKPALYAEENYRNANSCRTCHLIKRNFWNDIIRTTYLPEGTLVAQ